MADETQNGAETPEETIARLEAENAELQESLEAEQAAGAELAELLESGGDEGDEGEESDEGDEGDEGAEGAAEGAEGVVAEMAAFLDWAREFKRDFAVIREFVADELEARELAAREEEARDLSTVQETVRNLAAQNAELMERLEASNRALSGTGASGATVVVDHSRNLVEGSDHPFVVKKRELMEADPKLSAGKATLRARELMPREFADYSEKRAKGLI